MTTGQKIKMYRKDKGLSQQELAEKLGVSASMIGQYENDLRNPKYETLKRIATALELDVAYLDNRLTRYHIYDTPENDWRLGVCLQTDSGINHVPLESQEGKLLFSFEKLNENGRNEAIKRLAEMAQLSEYTE